MHDDDGVTLVKSEIYPTWRVESQQWFDDCKLGKNEMINLDCSQSTYSDFIQQRVKEITDETIRLDDLEQVNVTAIQEENTKLRVEVDTLTQDNKKLNECIVNSKTFEELQGCIK